MAGKRGRSSRGHSSIRRNVTWGFGGITLDLADPEFITNFWIVAPAGAVPADGVPQLDTDNTLIRTISFWNVGGPLTASPSQISQVFLGIIAWNGVFANDPDQQVDAANGSLDWIWRMPVGRPEVGGGSVAVNFPTTEEMVHSRSMRKFGRDLGLLGCIHAVGDDPISLTWDIRYAVKFPW